MRGRFARSAQLERGAAFPAQISNQLRARRTHLGLSTMSVARVLGIGANQYRAYESGAKLTPELLLTRIAEYFGVPALWLSPNLVHKTADAQKAVLRDRYRVATVEDRVNDLITVFCKLDLERQQELLAVAARLRTRSSRGDA